MVFLNYSTMQMVAKIVYYGPGLCGKTTNLKEIYQKTSPRSRGEMVSLETETDRTLFFDLLPMDVGVVGGFKTKFQLYTVPGQVFYNSTRKLVLRGVDGVVFVADSQTPMIEANKNSYDNLAENLKELGLNIEDVPMVFQFNKRDLPNILSVDELNQTLNLLDRPYIEASALKGAGVFETLKEISKQTLVKLKVKADSEFKKGQQVSLQENGQKEDIKKGIASRTEETPSTSDGEETVARATSGVARRAAKPDAAPTDIDSMPSIVSFEDEDISFDDEQPVATKPKAAADEKNIVFSVKSNPARERRELSDFDMDFDDDDLVEDSLDLEDFSELNEDELLKELTEQSLALPEDEDTLDEDSGELMSMVEHHVDAVALSDLNQEDLEDELEIEADFDDPILLEEPLSLDEEAPDSLSEPEPEPAPLAAAPEPPAAMNQIVTPKPNLAKKKALSSSLQEIESFATKVIKTRATKPADIGDSVEEMLSGLATGPKPRKAKSEIVQVSVPEPFSKAQLNCIFLDDEENVIHTQLIRVKRVKIGEGRYKINVVLDIKEN